MHLRHTRIVEIPRIDGETVPVRVTALEAILNRPEGGSIIVRGDGTPIETLLSVTEITALFSAAATRRISVPC